MYLLLLFSRDSSNKQIYAFDKIASGSQHSSACDSWSDARLFAVLNSERPPTMRFYELSNERTSVLWANMPARTLFQRREHTGYVEYRRKVEALLSLIAARTGLPLYDLSPLPGAIKKFRND
jgi:hypothetical protein